MRSVSLLPALLAFAAAAMAAVAVAAFMVNRIETTSEFEINRLFLAEQLDWADVAVDGLRVELTGTAPDEATRFEALTLAGTVVDATYVIDAMAVDPGKEVSPPSFSIEILRNDDGISVIGLAPSALDRGSVTRRLLSIAGEKPVTDLLETADYPEPDGWTPALDYALEALTRLPRSKISVAPNTVEITAISDSADQRRVLMTALRVGVPNGLNVNLDISAPRPVITPFTLRFVSDSAGPRFDACSADTAAGRAQILAAAAEAGLDGPADCRLGLGVPSPRWHDAVAEGLRAIGKLGGGTLSFSDADVTLIAPMGTPQRTFDTVVGELEAALPDVFSLTYLLPEVPKVNTDGSAEEDTTPEFVATLSEEGVLQLRGRVSSERQRGAVEGFARARFSTAEVNAAMRVADGLPGGWPGRVFAGLESMAYLSEGDLLVRPEIVTLSGVTYDPDARAEITRILADELGNAEDFALDIEFIEIVVEAKDLPTPRDCVNAINEVLAAGKITFAPGSADIDRSARASIDKIAEIMQGCTAVPMEIAGHTDSQGRETMNLALSQRRAEAVLEALMARRVLVANLTARGYGEQIPVADNDTEEGREANRRIEFTLRLRNSTGETEATAEDEPTAAEEEDVASEETGEDPSAEAEPPAPPESEDDTATDPDPDTAAEDPNAEAAPDDTPAAPETPDDAPPPRPEGGDQGPDNERDQ